MEKINKVCIILVASIVVFSFGVVIGHRMAQKSVNTQEILIDTAYNKIVLDSIEYNIIKKDSVISNIKHKMKDEIAESFNLDVSATVELFKSLAGAD